MDNATRSVRVEGDARGQIVVGEHNLTVTGERSIVTVLNAAERPKPRRRDRISLPPRRGTPPFGREAELATLVSAALEGRTLQVFAPPGSGKSVLLRHAARRLAEDGAEVVFLSGHGRDVEDIVQDLLEACYDTAGYRPGAVELRRMMAGIGVCLAVDDADRPADDLAYLFDAVPDGAVLLTSATRSLWGHGEAVPLDGLGRDAGVALIAAAVGGTMSETETEAAALLWRATDGHPLDLMRAAALARESHGPGALPRPAEVPEILSRVLSGLDTRGREIVGLLALADGVTASRELLALLADGPEEAVGPENAEAPEMTITWLAEAGLITESEHGCRLADGVVAALPDGVTAGQGRLAVLAERVTAWAGTAEPIDVARHQPFIGGLVDGLVRAGSPELGTRLARAAAPAAACSLRWGAWRRLLERGLGAARAAGDEPAQAYFAYENGIRSLLTGKRVAAAAGIAAAIAIWHRLGDTEAVEAARRAQDMAGMPQPSSDLDATSGSPDHTSGGDLLDHGNPQHGTVEHGTAQHGADSGSAGHAHDGARETVSAHGNTVTGTPGKGVGAKSGAGKGAGAKSGAGAGAGGGTGGMALTGKLIIGAALGGGLAAGGAWGFGQLSQPDNVPLHVKVSSKVIAVTLPERETDCAPAGKGTDCTWTIQAPRDKTDSIGVRPDGPLPKGVEMRYWGCVEGDAVPSCTVKADLEKNVCVTTTSAKDKAARKACAEFVARPQTPDTGVSAIAPTPTTPFVIQAATQWKVKIEGQPDACVFPSEEKIEKGEMMACHFDAPIGSSFTLTATINGPDPYPWLRNGGPDNSMAWYGCDEESPSQTCTVTVTQERVDQTRKWISDDPGNPKTRNVACLTTNDLAERTIQWTCANLTGSKEPPADDLGP